MWHESALRIHRSWGLVRGKSDKADSALIAEYAFRHADKAVSYRTPSPALRIGRRRIWIGRRLIYIQCGFFCTGCRKSRSPSGRNGVRARLNAKFSKKIADCGSALGINH